MTDEALRTADRPGRTRDATRGKRQRGRRECIAVCTSMLSSAPGASARLPWRRMEVIPVGGLFAAAERLRTPPALTEAAFRRQHRIVVALSRLSPAVFPVRFGAFMTDDELPQNRRARRTGAVTRAETGARRDQMTIRIFGPPLVVLPANPPGTGSEYLRARAAATRPTLTPVARALVKAVSSVVDAQHVGGSRGGVQLGPRPPRPAFERRTVPAAVSRPAPRNSSPGSTSPSPVHGRRSLSLQTSGHRQRARTTEWFARPQSRSARRRAESR